MKKWSEEACSSKIDISNYLHSGSNQTRQHNYHNFCLAVNQGAFLWHLSRSIVFLPLVMGQSLTLEANETICFLLSSVFVKYSRTKPGCWACDQVCGHLGCWLCNLAGMPPCHYTRWTSLDIRNFHIDTAQYYEKTPPTSVFLMETKLSCLHLSLRHLDIFDDLDLKLIQIWFKLSLLDS